MFEKAKIKGKIKKMLKEIEAVEKKRSRSQSALVEAILTNETPSDEDVDYFNRYTEKINEIRDDMHMLEQQLKAL